MAFTYRPVRLLQNLFGYGKGKEPDFIDPSQVEPVVEDNSFAVAYAKSMELRTDRVGMYQEMETMDEDDIVECVLDLISEDCTQQDLTTNKTVWVSSSNEKIVQIGNNLFDDLGMEDEIFSITRAMAKYGDIFYSLIQAKKDDKTPGAIKVMKYRNPKGVHRHQDKFGKLLGFSMGDEMSEKAMSPPWAMSHFRLLGKKGSNIKYADEGYGYAYLAPARRIYRRWKMMEDALAIYRIKRCPDRFKFALKGMDAFTPEERRGIMNKVRQDLRKKVLIDPETGRVRSEVDPMCFTGDTKVSLLDGREVSLSDLMVEFGVKDKEFWVYSYDTEKNRIVPGRAVHLGVTGKCVKQLLEVELDNGEVLRCTPNHRWLIRDGTYKSAEELGVGDSLMPSETRERKKREKAEALVANNHKVKSIRFVDVCEDVYDIQVEDYHNFALTAGVFVHNSIDEDYFFDPDAVSIDKIEGTKTVGHVLDVEYMRKRFFSCIKVPPDYLGFSDARGGFLSASPLCLIGNTKISLVDGRERTMLELLDEFGDDKFWVYSCKLPNRRTVPGLAHSVRKTGEQTETVVVKLDNGEEVTCTPGHPFLMTSGKYVQASDLKPGDSLTALYRKDSKIHPGYEEVFDHASNRWLFTSRLFVKENHSTAVDEKGRFVKRNVVHHKNKIPRDNRPDNLIKMSWENHQEIHYDPWPEGLIRWSRSPEGRESHRRLAKAMNGWGFKKWYNGSAKQLVDQLRRWEDPEFRKKMSIVSRENMRKIHEAHANDPDYGLRGMWKRAKSDPELAEKLYQTACENGKKVWDNKSEGEKTDTISKMCAGNKKHWESMSDEEKKEKISKLSKGSGERTKSRWANMSEEKKREWVEKVQAGRKRKAEERKNQPVMNHKVVSVCKGPVEDVYDLTVDDYHNFALTAGVFVHNSHQDVQFARQCKRIKRSVGLGLTRLVQIHMCWNGIDPELPENEFAIESVPVSYLEEIQRAQLYEVRAKVLAIMEDIGKALGFDRAEFLPYLIQVAGLPKSLLDIGKAKDDQVVVTGDLLDAKKVQEIRVIFESADLKAELAGRVAQACHEVLGEGRPIDKIHSRQMMSWLEPLPIPMRGGNPLVAEWAEKNNKNLIMED